MIQHNFCWAGASGSVPHYFYAEETDDFLFVSNTKLPVKIVLAIVRLHKMNIQQVDNMEPNHVMTITLLG